MSKYILIHGQFHELPDDALMHWKYVKREKVGDKWKYYYSWDELKKDVKNALPSNKVDLKKDSRLIYDKRGTAADVTKENTKTANIDLQKDSRLIYDKRGTTAIAKTNNKTDAELNDVAKKVIRGDYGNGVERVNKLKEEGYDPDTVQNLVNDTLSGKSKTENSKQEESNKATDTSTANSDVDLKKDSRIIYDKRGTAEDIARNHANANTIDLKRDSRLIYDKRGTSADIKRKNVDKIVSKVIRGDYGNGSERSKKLETAGYDYVSVQGLVNERLRKKR